MTLLATAPATAPAAPEPRNPVTTDGVRPEAVGAWLRDATGTGEA